MKWYVGILSEILAAIVGIGSILYVEGNDQITLPTSTQNALIIAVFVIAFIGGFMAPYHVKKTASYAAGSFGILAGIPLVAVLAATGELTDDDSGDWTAVFLLILLIVVAIVLVISIVVVTVLLFVGGTVGSIFGRMVFSEDRYEDDFKSSEYYDPKKSP